MALIISLGGEVIVFVEVSIYPSNGHVELTFALCIQENKTI